MPSSTIMQVPTIVNVCLSLCPKKILDLGFGFGKYGFLLREYLELWRKDAKLNERITTIHGIEGFEPYVNDIQKAIYDKIYIGDITKIVNEISNDYDLILLIDVFEHFRFDIGKIVLLTLTQKAKHILISTPKNVLIQDAVFGNEFEIHQTQWENKFFADFAKLNNLNCSFVKNNYNIICLLGK